MSINIENYINNAQTSILEGEKFLNKCGYVPLLSTVSGQFRSLIGVIQAVAFGALSGYATFVGNKELAKHYFTVMVDGVANIVRGYVETVFLVGNACCFIYDKGEFLSGTFGETVISQINFSFIDPKAAPQVK